MSKVSRRALARYAADQLMAGQSAATIAKRLAAELVESGRTGEAEFILADIAWELEQRRELAVGRVTSAHSLSKEVLTELKNQLKKATLARQVSLEENIDENILGGIKVETAGWVWDMSVRRKLTDLKEVF